MSGGWADNGSASKFIDNFVFVKTKFREASRHDLLIAHPPRPSFAEDGLRYASCAPGLLAPASRTEKRCLRWSAPNAGKAVCLLQPRPSKKLRKEFFLDAADGC